MVDLIGILIGLSGMVRTGCTRSGRRCLARRGAIEMRTLVILGLTVASAVLIVVLWYKFKGSAGMI